MVEGTEKKGLLGRLSVVVGILGGVATIASVSWTIFHKDSTDIVDYQNHDGAGGEELSGHGLRSLSARYREECQAWLGRI